ncbi:MAG: fibrobacter succinogenes major paralogous domain-containing protein [Chitinispirillales bacterium]|nr:fibrobacter succinogenes major paralogous domain-containing protein [Chitinispirillales bacterium]
MTITNRNLRALFLAAALCLAAGWLSLSAAQGAGGAGTFTDTRDGKIYKTVTIGGKRWLAENLNHNLKNSGCYGDDDSNCSKYGRLYDWKTGMMACPSGWHLSTRMEWDDLVKSTGGNQAGNALKSSSGWNNRGNGTDKYGFSALPGGDRYAGGSFGNAGSHGNWWTATEGVASNAYYRYMLYNYDDVYEFNGGKSRAFSVRCVKD